MNAAYEMLDRDILQILWDTLPSGFFDYGLAGDWGFITLFFLFVTLIFFSVPFCRLYEDCELFFVLPRIRFLFSSLPSRRPNSPNPYPRLTGRK